MRVFPLHRDSDTDYSCVSYWILGDMNNPGDRNTFIDPGSSNLANLGYFMREMNGNSKGIGKMAIEQVILTHAHYDHAGGLPGIVRQFDPVVYSWTAVEGKYQNAADGMHVRVGDEDAVILHTPGHSEDSVCVFVPGTGILFSGDTLYTITDNQGVYPQAYSLSLQRLSALGVKCIYPGHGSPVLADAAGYIRACLDHVSRSQTAD